MRTALRLAAAVIGVGGIVAGTAASATAISLYTAKNPTGGAVASLTYPSNWIVICDEQADGHRAVVQLTTNPASGGIVFDMRAAGNSNCEDTNITKGTDRTRYMRACLADSANVSDTHHCSAWKKVTLN